MTNPLHDGKGGLAGVVGLIIGAVLGLWAASLAGYELIPRGDSSGSTVAVLVAAAVGGGLGMALARLWRGSSRFKQDDSE